LDGKQTAVGRARLGLQRGQIAEPTLAAKVIGRVADGLDAQGAAFLQVLLDPRVLVENIDDHVHSAGDDLRREGPVGVRADLAAKGELNLMGAAQVEVGR
jgi:hypothetical protein